MGPLDGKKLTKVKASHAKNVFLNRKKFGKIGSENQKSFGICCTLIFSLIIQFLSGEEDQRWGH